MKSLQSIVQQLQKLLPKLKKEERQIAKFLYQKLALGRSVAIETIANELQNPMQQIQDYLEQMAYVEYNAVGEISAYRGVTLNQTNHYVFHNKSKICTWCAFDTLFLADLLVKPVCISSNCPTCCKAIAFTVTDQDLTSLNDTGIVMSFTFPNKIDYCEDLQNAFCSRVHFFCNEQCGSDWEDLSAEIDFFDLVEALEISRERNRQFLGNG
jgi:alkylmercury lyase